MRLGQDTHANTVRTAVAVEEVGAARSLPVRWCSLTVLTLHGLALQVLPLDSCRVRGVRFPCPGSARSLLRRYYGEDCLETVKKDLHVANMESKERAGGFDAVRGMDAAGMQ